MLTAVSCDVTGHSQCLCQSTTLCSDTSQTITVFECFCAEFIKHIYLSYAFNTKDKHKVYIFLVSVTGMYLNQLNTIVNALWNISHTIILECEVTFVSWCTNLVLWILHFGTVGDKCTDDHKIKPYLNQNGWLLVSVNISHIILVAATVPVALLFPLFF